MYLKLHIPYYCPLTGYQGQQLSHRIQKQDNVFLFAHCYTEFIWNTRSRFGYLQTSRQGLSLGFFLVGHQLYYCQFDFNSIWIRYNLFLTLKYSGGGNCHVK